MFAAMSALAMDSMGHIVGEGPLINAEKACLVGEVHNKGRNRPTVITVTEMHSIRHYPCCMRISLIIFTSMASTQREDTYMQRNLLGVFLASQHLKLLH